MISLLISFGFGYEYYSYITRLKSNIILPCLSIDHQIAKFSLTHKHNYRIQEMNETTNIGYVCSGLRVRCEVLDHKS